MSLGQEIADGEICGICNIPFTEEHGYPVICSGCWEPGWDGYQKAVYPLDDGRDEDD